MLTEATEVRADGHGYPNTPGIYTDEQMAAWRPIVEAVVAKGATFFCQLWHCGRASHSVYQPDGTTSTFVGVPALVGRSGGASAVCTSMAACPVAAKFLFCACSVCMSSSFRTVALLPLASNVVAGCASHEQNATGLCSAFSVHKAVK